MASDAAPEHPEVSPSGTRSLLSLVERKRLQRLFEHGSKQMAQDNHDYAAELLGGCVRGDPGNLSYVQSFLGNLQKKYNNNKTGASRLAQLGKLKARSAVRKAVSAGQWKEVIELGLNVLLANPWDVQTLTAMATACENLGAEEPELYYLKSALDVNPKDPDVNRQCAMALAARRQYKQAIACWERVKQARPGDEEADREISRLYAEQTIDHGGYGQEDEAKRGKGSRPGQPAAPEPRRELTQEELLEERIAREPDDLSAYYELAEVQFTRQNYQAAVDVLGRALKASAGDETVRDRLEDAELRLLRHQIDLAAQAADETTKRERIKQYNKKHLDYSKRLADRFPNNLRYRYDLGIWYQRNKMYHEAIKEYQQARNDSALLGRCNLALGQCFQRVNQPRLAMSHYEQAIETLAEREQKERKDALLLAAGLAFAQKDLDKAEDYATRLAAVDFGYGDVASLLDKITESRNQKEKEKGVGSP